MNEASGLTADTAGKIVERGSARLLSTTSLNSVNRGMTQQHPCTETWHVKQSVKETNACAWSNYNLVCFLWLFLGGGGWGGGEGGRLFVVVVVSLFLFCLFVCLFFGVCEFVVFFFSFSFFLFGGVVVVVVCCFCCLFCLFACLLACCCCCCCCCFCVVVFGGGGCLFVVVVCGFLFCFWFFTPSQPGRLYQGERDWKQLKIFPFGNYEG